MNGYIVRYYKIENIFIKYDHADRYFILQDNLRNNNVEILNSSLRKSDEFMYFLSGVRIIIKKKNSVILTI